PIAVASWPAPFIHTGTPVCGRRRLPRGKTNGGTVRFHVCRGGSPASLRSSTSRISVVSIWAGLGRATRGRKCIGSVVGGDAVARPSSGHGAVGHACQPACRFSCQPRGVHATGVVHGRVFLFGRCSPLGGSPRRVSARSRPR